MTDPLSRHDLISVQGRLSTHNLLVFVYVTIATAVSFCSFTLRLSVPYSVSSGILIIALCIFWNIISYIRGPWLNYISCSSANCISLPFLDFWQQFFIYFWCFHDVFLSVKICCSRSA